MHTMHMRTTIAVVSATLVFSGLGCNSGGGGGGGASAPKHETPDAAFKAVTDAGNNEEWGTLCGSLTDESVEVLAGTMAMMGSVMESMGQMAALGGEDAKKEFDEQFSKIKAVLDKHGVKSDPSMLGAMMGGGSPDPKAMKGLVASVTDKAGFVTEIMTAMSAAKKGANGGKGPGAPPGLAIPENAKLVDLAVDGDTATAKIDADGQQHPIGFKKIDGGWKLDMVPMIEASMKKGAAAPAGAPAAAPAGAPAAK